jgi:hypothetical protein
MGEKIVLSGSAASWKKPNMKTVRKKGNRISAGSVKCRLKAEADHVQHDQGKLSERP